jgi:integrase/recombinase XerD
LDASVGEGGKREEVKDGGKATAHRTTGARWVTDRGGWTFGWLGWTEFGLCIALPQGRGTRKEQGMNSGFEKAKEEVLRDLVVRNYAPATVDQNEQYLGYFFRFLERQGITDLREVGRETLKSYQLELAQGKTAKGKPYSWGTKCGYFQPVRRLFGHLEKTQQIFLNPAELIRDPKPESRLPKNIMSEEQVVQILAVPDVGTPAGYRDRTIMEVFYSTGIRLAELTNLKPGDCDLEGGLLRVTMGKGKKDRVVPIGGVAAEYLKTYMEEVRPRFIHGEDLPPQLWLTKRVGFPLSKVMVNINLRHYGRRAGIPFPVTPHSFRHTFATHMIKRGADINAVSKMMGHSSIKVTQIYTHLSGVDVKKGHEEHHPRERGKGEPVEVAVPEITQMFRGPQS